MASDDEEACDYFYDDDDDAEEDAAAGLEEDSSLPTPEGRADYWVSDLIRTRGAPASRGDDNCVCLPGWDFRAGEIWEDLADRFENRPACPDSPNLYISSSL
jgi:hypothetical protein